LEAAHGFRSKKTQEPLREGSIRRKEVTPKRGNRKKDEETPPSRSGERGEPEEGFTLSKGRELSVEKGF